MAIDGRMHCLAELKIGIYPARVIAKVQGLTHFKAPIIVTVKGRFAEEISAWAVKLYAAGVVCRDKLQLGFHNATF